MFYASWMQIGTQHRYGLHPQNTNFNELTIFFTFVIPFGGCWPFLFLCRLFCILGDVWIQTQVAAVASTNLATQLPFYFLHSFRVRSGAGIIWKFEYYIFLVGYIIRYGTVPTHVFWSNSRRIYHQVRYGTYPRTCYDRSCWRPPWTPVSDPGWTWRTHCWRSQHQWRKL